jgi:hypothetical protein
VTKAEAQVIFDDIYSNANRIKVEIQNIKSKASDFDTTGHDLDSSIKALDVYLYKLQEEIEELE